MALPCTRLLILACSATKRNDPRYMPAIDRYDGPLWRTLRTVDPRREKAQVAFLSAHLGFRAADMPIEIYDARMTETMVAAMKRGDLGTRWPRPTSHARVMPSGEYPGMHIALFTEHREFAFCDVGLTGGYLYLDVMRHLVDLFRKAGYVAGDARITEINRSIGLMRRDLRRWLRDQNGEAG